jgi:hypothetical protein
MSKHTHELVNPIQKYSIAEHNDVAFNSLYKRQQEIIQASPEFENLNNLVDDDTDSMPF